MASRSPFPKRALAVAAFASVLAHGWLLGHFSLRPSAEPTPMRLEGSLSTCWVGEPTPAKPPETSPTSQNPPFFEENKAFARIQSAQSAPKNVATEVTANTQPPAASAQPGLAVPSRAVKVAPSSLLAASSASDVPAQSPAVAAPASAAASTQVATVTPTTPASVAATAPGSALALQLPAPVQMHYSVRATDAQGTVREGSGVLTWRHDGQRYDLRLDVSASGQSLLSQTSRGRIGAAGLEPERFSDRRQRRSEQAVHFQRERSLISFSNNSAETALNEGAQDRLSVLVQLAGLLAGQSSSGPIPDQLSLPVASLSEAEVWTFQSEGLKPASPADGGTPLEARLLIRAERRAFDDRVEIWLAPSIGHWPVRIRMVQGGGAGFDLIWKP